MVSIIALITLVATAAALKVTYPTESDVWKTGESQTITWDTVSTDPSVVDVYLSNMASYPTTSILLASDVSASDGKLTIDGSKLAVGTAFTINLSNGSTQIYAQSVSPPSFSPAIFPGRTHHTGNSAECVLVKSS